MANRAIKKEWDEQEIDFKTFMSLMVVLIPMLLVCAQFAKIAVIEIKLPEARGSQTIKKVKKPPKADESNKLLLTAVITDSVVTLGAKGGFLPSVFYQEYHRYVDKDNKAIDFTVKYDPKATEPPKHPQSGRDMEIYERYDIYLYACPDDYSEVIKCLYTKMGKLCTDAESVPVKEMVNVGDTIYELTNPRRLVVVQDPTEYEIKELSVYDQFKNSLMKVKERFKDADDGDDIIIAAENQVMYDKIIQIMDAAKEADFPNISIAKLRSF